VFDVCKRDAFNADDHVVVSAIRFDAEGKRQCS
jgi:hypothetical protein